MNKIEKQVLKKITPTLKYKKNIKKIIKEINEKLNAEIKKRRLPVTVELVGSIAKDTYLKNDLDIDFFIKFPRKYSKEEIGKKALSIGRKILKNTEESYAEHPYIRGYYKKYKVEIVPCYKIEKSSQKLSAVDRTPLHTRFIKKYLKNPQKSQVRLLKQFLKGIGCYGAEAEIEGFSGYLTEIIILKYGSFEKVIENVQKWKNGETLTLTHDNFSFFETPLIFIDPVDPKRNVASAVSKEKFDLFIKACKEYVKKPSINFFFPRKTEPWSLKKIKEEIDKQKCKYVGLKFLKPKIISENLYPQVRKAVKSIKKLCEKYDFKILDTRYHINNKIYIIIKTEIDKLPNTKKHVGPPASLKENVDDFIKKWDNNPKVIKKPYEKNGRFFVEVKRSYTDVKDLLENEIKNLSLGKQLDHVIKQNYTILETHGLINDDLRMFWTEYLDNKMPWER
ncbi:MAG: CCA tRNA nucleotidyltransferase [Thermoplasmatota archaeon]|jgi:tRNA nucleotidyltransferase (CCA-adding enzyme)